MNSATATVAYERAQAKPILLLARPFRKHEPKALRVRPFGLPYALHRRVFGEQEAANLLWQRSTAEVVLKYSLQWLAGRRATRDSPYVNVEQRGCGGGGLVHRCAPAPSGRCGRDVWGCHNREMLISNSARSTLVRVPVSVPPAATRGRTSGAHSGDEGKRAARARMRRPGPHFTRRNAEMFIASALV